MARIDQRRVSGFRRVIPLTRCRLTAGILRSGD